VNLCHLLDAVLAIAEDRLLGWLERGGLLMFRTVILVVVLGLAVVACGPPTKHDVMKKAEGAETKQELEAAVGPPDDVSRLGPIERWTYQTSDGEVHFVITNDRIRLEATSAKADDEEPPRDR
jgi:hypothetical protein